jgi:hypothetical protein
MCFGFGVDAVRLKHRSRVWPIGNAFEKKGNQARAVLFGEVGNVMLSANMKSEKYKFLISLSV